MRSTFFFLILFLSVSVVNGQYSAFPAHHSFRYAATPGFVNVTEFNGALGLKDFEGPTDSPWDPESINSKYFFGVTNVIGYQIDRHFFGGIGVGYYKYQGDGFIPFYIEYKYSMYFKGFNTYFYGDGGTLIHPEQYSEESKIFINPGIGISHTISPKMDINLSAGYMIQARTTISRVAFLNFKLGISWRKNSFRMFRSEKVKINDKYFYNTLK